MDLQKGLKVNTDPFGAAHSSTSISAGLGMALLEI